MVRWDLPSQIRWVVLSAGYATSQYLLDESYHNARMFGFYPQAVMIYAASRRMLMGDDLVSWNLIL